MATFTGHSWLANVFVRLEHETEHGREGPTLSPANFGTATPGEAIPAEMLPVETPPTSPRHRRKNQ